MAFEIPDSSEVWRQIPPEEKLALMNKAHATGVLSTVISLIILCTIAVGLQLNWLMWGSFLTAPFVFQFASGKRWRALRPKMMLEYMAARSAARRFAYAAGSKDMRVLLMFRGTLETVFDEEHRTEELEAQIADHKEAEVWIALFSDCVIMMSERPGGAELAFGYMLTDKMKIEGRSPDGEGEYSSHRAIYFTCLDKLKEERHYILTSPFPAALVVFEKQTLQNQREHIEALGRDLAEIAPPSSGKNFFRGGDDEERGGRRRGDPFADYS